jgi:hypothetical protein
VSLPTTTALRLTEVIAGIGLTVTSLEIALTPSLTDSKSLGDWSLLRLAGPPRRPAVSRWRDRLLDHPQVRLIAGIRAVSAATAVFADLQGAAHTELLGLIVLTSLLLMNRSSLGSEGADQVLFLVFTTLFLMAVSGDRVAYTVGLWFLALQAALAYFTSGVTKLCSRSWRDGSALVQIMATRTLGIPRASRLMARHPRMTRFGAMTLVLCETSWALVLLSPPDALPYFFAFGVVFHVTCAVVMGLNIFPWAFLSLYPAVAWVVTR